MDRRVFKSICFRTTNIIFQAQKYYNNTYLFEETCVVLGVKYVFCITRNCHKQKGKTHLSKDVFWLFKNDLLKLQNHFMGIVSF